MVQNGPNDHFGPNCLIPNWILNLAFARPKWTKTVHFGQFWPQEVHFGPFRSANRTLAIPEFYSNFEKTDSLTKFLVSSAGVLKRAPNFIPPHP